METVIWAHRLAWGLSLNFKGEYSRAGGRFTFLWRARIWCKGRFFALLQIFIRRLVKERRKTAEGLFPLSEEPLFAFDRSLGKSEEAIWFYFAIYLVRWNEKNHELSNSRLGSTFKNRYSSPWAKWSCVWWENNQAISGSAHAETEADQPHMIQYNFVHSFFLRSHHNSASRWKRKPSRRRREEQSQPSLAPS